MLSVGWVGALAVFMAHALACLVSSDELVVRATAVAMGITAWLVILPLSIGTLRTGLVQASGSAWGLLRHYWVLFKLVLTALAIVVLLLKLPSIAMLAETARGLDFALAGTRGPRTSIALHAAGGLCCRRRASPGSGADGDLRRARSLARLTFP